MVINLEPDPGEIFIRREIQALSVHAAHPLRKWRPTADRIPILAVLRAGHLHFDGADN
jgi:hypothetical protein